MNSGTIKLNEFCSKPRAHWMLKNIDDIAEQLDIKEEPKTKIIKYCNEVLKTESGIIKRIYQNKDGFGRMFLKNGQIGYQNIKRELRAILACKDYYDLDIVNCQPSILLRYCEAKGINSLQLKEYVDHREDHIKAMNLPKAIIKNQFISVIYGGKFDYNIFIDVNQTEKTFLHDFEKEMNNTLNEVLNHNEELTEQITDENSNNIKGRVCSLMCQIIENDIIQHTLRFLRLKGFEISALMFDGLMIRKTLNLSSSIISDLNNYILKKQVMILNLFRNLLIT